MKVEVTVGISQAVRQIRKVSKVAGRRAANRAIKECTKEGVQGSQAS